MLGGEGSLQLRVLLAVIFVGAEPVAEGEVTVPPVAVRPLDEMNLMGATPVRGATEVTPEAHFRFQLGDVLVADTGERVHDVRSRGNVSHTDLHVDHGLRRE